MRLLHELCIKKSKKFLAILIFHNYYKTNKEVQLNDIPVD